MPAYTYTSSNDTVPDNNSAELVLGHDRVNLLVNGSFETGDLTGWDTFLVPSQPFDTTVLSVSTVAPRTGTYAASVATGDNPVEAGFEQTVEVIPGQHYCASAWLGFDNWYHFSGGCPDADVGFEVLAPDGTVLASAFTTPYATGQCGARVDDLVAPGSEVRFRLVYLDRYAEWVDVIFDDAVLSVDPPPDNLGFETGDLLGWEHIETGYFTLRTWLVDSPVWEGDYAARVRVDSDLPNGIERPGISLGTCTSVWAQLVYGPPATARLEIESATGDLYTEDLTLNTVGVWQYLNVLHPDLGDGSTVRLLVVDGDGSQIVFDSVTPGYCT